MVFSLCHYIWDFCLRISLLLKGAGTQFLAKSWKNGQNMEKYLGKTDKNA